LGPEVFTRLPFNEKAEKGRTLNRGIYIRMNKSRFWASIALQRFTGFYLDNPGSAFRAELPAGFFPLEPDMRSNLIHASGYYIFKPKKFSNMAAQGENERQLKSGGSFFAVLGFYYDNLMLNKGLIPASEAKNFVSQVNLVQLTSRSFSLNGGYAHTFVFLKNMYFAMYFAPGLAIFNGNQRFKDNEVQKLRGQVTLRLDT